MLDRVATVLGLVFLAAIAVPFFINRAGEAEAKWIVPTISVLVLGGIAGLAALMMLDSLPSRFGHYRVVRGLAQLAVDTRTVFLSPGDATKVLVISVVGHANVALAVYFIGISLDLDITWVDCMVLTPPVFLLMTLPISIAGWGVREGAMVTAFALIGIPAEDALVMSILLSLAAIVMALPGGVVWMMSSDRKIEETKHVNANR